METTIVDGDQHLQSWLSQGFPITPLSHQVVGGSCTLVGKPHLGHSSEDTRA